MGIRAICQRGRGKPGLVLPANATEKINQVKDRGSLVKWSGPPSNRTIETSQDRLVEHATDPLANIGTSVAAKWSSAEEPVTVEQTVNCEVAAAETHEAVADIQVGVEVPVDVPASSDGEAVDMHVTSTDVVAESRGEPEVESDDLTMISGIGPALQRRLFHMNIKTFTQLADADPVQLNELPGVKGRGAEWIEQAKRMCNLMDQ